MSHRIIFQKWRGEFAQIFSLILSLPRITFILPWVPGVRDLVVDVPDEGDELRAGLDHELELRPLPLEVLVLTAGTGHWVTHAPLSLLPITVGSSYLVLLI